MTSIFRMVRNLTLKTKGVALLVAGLALASMGAHAQGPAPLPRCQVGQLIVNGAYREAQAKQQGQSYDHQVLAVQTEAKKLADRFGANVANTYADVQTKLLQNLYTNDAYSQMTPDQFRDAITASFMSGCGQQI